jgi:hypothetical protein
LGIPAYDYDILNDYGETDYQIDLFSEIEKSWGGVKSIFDKISKDDLVIAFFPCIYFTGSTNPCYYTLENNNYKNLSLSEKLNAILKRAKDRQNFFELLIKMIGICLKRNIRIIFENPYTTQHYLHNNFFKEPTIIDKNRMLRGDYFKKPTGYWFFNCEATQGFSYQNDKEQKTIIKSKGAIIDGLCSEERSMISPDYARNFICDFILGKKQNLSQLSLF